MKKQNNEITIKGLIDIFLPKLWLVAIVSVICAAVLGVFSMVQKDTYTSTGTYEIYKINYSNPDAMTGLSPTEVEGIQSMIANLKVRVKTDDFANAVIEKIGKTGTLTAEQVKKTFAISIVEADSTCYYFSVTTPSPTLSAELAFEAGQLLEDTFADGTRNYAVKIDTMDKPKVPTSANSKNVVRNAILGFAGGMIVSLLVVFIASRFDVIIRSREKIEDAFDLPLLGVIPAPEEDI